MNRRKQLIEAIEKKRNSKVIVYITGDRPNLNTRIAPDVIRPLVRHLNHIGKQKRIDLFLYTRGGDVITPLRINHLVREFADQFGVIVPYKAYSAGTLICLGADDIVMGVLGELGPIDPTVANQFNPSDPYNPNAKIPISVEDVFAYLSLAKERAKLSTEHEMTEVFKALTDQIHPLALGNIHRHYTLIRHLAEKLIRLRKKGPNEAKTRELVDLLSERLYSHSYIISRREAKDIGLPVTNPDEELAELCWSLFTLYEQQLKLNEPFLPDEILTNGEKEIEFEAIGGYLESAELTDVFKFYGTIQTTVSNQQEMLSINIKKQNWETVEQDTRELVSTK